MGRVKLSILVPSRGVEEEESRFGQRSAIGNRFSAWAVVPSSSRLLDSSPSRLGLQVESQPGLNHAAPGAKGIWGMSSLYEAKQFAHNWIDQNRQRLSEFDLEIWRYAETAWREYRSAKAYVDLLRREGFDVEEGSGEMPTAFLATWGTS